MGYVGISQIREVFQEDLVDIMETKGRQVPVQFPVDLGGPWLSSRWQN
jgi:hypothetical protein